MDIKLKKYKKGLFALMTTLCVIAAAGAFLFALILFMLYEVSSVVLPDGTSPMAEAQQLMEQGISNFWLCQIGCDVIFLTTLIYSIANVGEKDEDGVIKNNFLDKIFTEVQLLVGGFSWIGLFAVITMTGDYLFRSNWLLGNIQQIDKFEMYFTTGTFSPLWVEATFAVALLIAIMTLELALFLSIIKKIKAKTFWKYSICGGAVIYLIDSFRKNDHVFWKLMLVLVVGCLLSATIFGAVIVLIAIFIFVPMQMKKYMAVKNGINEVKSGNLNYKIDVNGIGELDRLAMGINEISAASNIAVQNELKNQRLKTDLISNVSHDLKTPLTSMVTYIDLLKTEGLDCEGAPEYLDIIDKKTKRLQKLTEDLFEAAKASSGAIPVNMEKIEMISIVNQALGELEEKLLAKNLNVIFTSAMEKAYVKADGQLLWRVIENLLVNVSKYALDGSRVYIDLQEKTDSLIVLEVKNISRDPLNISADELMERFKRGDESRATEGSGLGLAIAKDLTKLMKGWFDISIDGDLFKASIVLVKEAEPEPTNQSYEEESII
ncbi:MAG: HAMP domain-containing sensor histidine kinase [Anaerovoracaceae bacterium]